MKYLFIFAIGAVQEFIATARRSRDLWFGSWMLSELAKAAAKKLDGISPGSLVFPALIASDALDPGSEFTAPNKVVAIFDQEIDTAEIQAAVKYRLMELWNDAKARIIDKGGRIYEETAQAQIDDLSIG